MPNQYINKVIYGGRTLIDLTSDTVEASKLLLGTKAHDKSGAQIEGTCTFDVDSTDATAAAAEILAGKTAYVSANNIREGVTILGIEGTMSGSENMKPQAKTVTPSTAKQTILPDAEYNCLSQVEVEAIPYVEADNPAGGVTVTIAG